MTEKIRRPRRRLSDQVRQDARQTGNRVVSSKQEEIVDRVIQEDSERGRLACVFVSIKSRQC